jgi:hypothetical protein
MKGPNGVLAVLLILAIAFASLSALEYAVPRIERTTTTSVTTSTTTTTVTRADSALWEVLKDNLTVHGQTACVAINWGALGGCPSPIPSGNGTLSNVELISYNGSEYYSVTFPPLPAGAIFPGVKFTIWFTNSTIFCAKPLFGLPAIGYPVCP